MKGAEFVFDPDPTLWHDKYRTPYCRSSSVLLDIRPDLFAECRGSMPSRIFSVSMTYFVVADGVCPWNLVSRSHIRNRSNATKLN